MSTSLFPIRKDKLGVARKRFEASRHFNPALTITSCALRNGDSRVIAYCFKSGPEEFLIFNTGLIIHVRRLDW